MAKLKNRKKNDAVDAGSRKIECIILLKVFCAYRFEGFKFIQNVLRMQFVSNYLFSSKLRN